MWSGVEFSVTRDTAPKQWLLSMRFDFFTALNHLNVRIHFNKKSIFDTGLKLIAIILLFNTKIY